MNSIRFAALTAMATTSVCALGGPQEQPFRGDIEVTRIITEVRVVHSDGSPVLGLGLDDFRAAVDGRSAEVESVEWSLDADRPERPERTGNETLDEMAALPDPDHGGRLIVILYQTDFALNRSRVVGLFRIDGHAVDWVNSLRPADRVAAAVMGSHLQLHSDFTNDFERLGELLMVDEVLKWRCAEYDGRTPSLAAHFDYGRAKRATNLSEALAVLGDALAPIPGHKAVVVLGWGAGRYDARMGTVHLGRDYHEALESLAAADASVFTLDITDADYHSLEVGLRQYADDTGGLYIKTHLFPQLAMEKVARALTGHYDLTLVPPDDLGPSFRVRIRVDRPGIEVLVRRTQFDDS